TRTRTNWRQRRNGGDEDHPERVRGGAQGLEHPRRGRGREGHRGRVRHQGGGARGGGRGGRAGGRRGGTGGRGADGVHGHLDRGRRQQDQRHQSGPRADAARPQGGEGPGRRGAEAGARERGQGGRREGGGEAEGSRRDGGDEVRSDPSLGLESRVFGPGYFFLTRPSPWPSPLEGRGK